MSNYQEFLRSKQRAVVPAGFEVSESAINPKLFKFQNAIVRWALRLGKAALFEECGLGKTFQQLEWARLVAAHTGGRVLILAPLAVAHQTIAEGTKLGIPVQYARDASEMGDTAIVITNYERLSKFDASAFAGVVLDESSILKSFMGKTKRMIIDTFRGTPYKLACTATPAPNDYTEIGNHAEFLDVKLQAEMLAMWFVNDASETGTWRLKKHAAADFWRWLTSWAVCISRPGDLGAEYDLPEFELPPLNIHEYRLSASAATIERAWNEGRLFADDSASSTGLHKVKRESLTDRVAEAVKIVAAAGRNQPFILWCDTDYEADALIKAFPDAVEVRGSQPIETKEERLDMFSDGRSRLIITKPDIAGFGLNWQHCPNQIFVGVSYSFEKTYQALRRSYRFGQKQPVNAHLIYAETEGNVVTVLNEKQDAFIKMQQAMNEAMKQHGLFRQGKDGIMVTGEHKTAQGVNWTLHLGDCVEQIAHVRDNSVGLSVYSPPFPDIFMYTDSPHDMGNVLNLDEFVAGYKFLVKEIYRVTMPGRLTVVHCVDLPSFKYKHGVTGLRDFPGEIIKAHLEAGWIYHSRVTIWKNPVTEMQRTKAHALLHKHFVDRAEQVRQGLPDYLIVMRKPESDGDIVHVNQHRTYGDYIGTNPPNVNENYSIAVWQRYASPVWFDIDQSNVLNYQVAKDNEDEKHICPLQLDVIARSIDLWTNPGEIVFSPFAGIGSEGYQALKQGRKFIGIELKESYWRLAQKHLAQAELLAAQPDLFSWAQAQGE